MYPMAAGYSASVDKEMTNFTGRVHRDNLDAFYALFRNALLAPAFSEADFNRIKAQRLNFLERARRYSRDEELSKELLFWMAYEGTPYQHPAEGYVESVRAITLGRCACVLSRSLRPQQHRHWHRRGVSGRISPNA